jgi:DNA-binding transcriptional MerR regulator
MKDDAIVRWTIEELRAAVASALASGYGGPPNGRVREVPDQRTIRYYTTLGLIDRAAEMRGRTALYSTRHLLQLVAIKKLQALGQSLAEVQEALLGQPTGALARLAGIDLGKMKEKGNPTTSSRRSFWKDAPAPVCTPTTAATRQSDERTSHARSDVGERPRQLQGIQLAADVTLLLASSQMLDDGDLAALRAAASPLIDVLTKLEIIAPREEGEPQ